MNEPSLFEKSEKTMTTKELAEVLGVDVRTVNGAVERLLESTFQKFGAIKTLSNGGRPTKIFNETQATLIKREIQKHHNLANRQIDEVSTEMEVMLKIQEGYALAVQKMKEYKLRAEQAESVVNRIADSSGLKTIKEAADILGYGEKTYFAMLRGLGIIFYENGINLPKREYIESKYFEVKEEPYERNGKTYLYSRIYVTAKGLLWLEKKTPSVRKPSL